MTRKELLNPGSYYHIYNRGNNRENIFIEEKNYRYFLKRYAQYIEPVACTYAYCLLRNHFHLAVRIRSNEEQMEYQQTCGVSETPQVSSRLDPSLQFSHLFNAYAKSINKAYGRTGSLFEGRFKRILLTSRRQMMFLVAYIHRNPEKHGFVEGYRDWPYSAYATILSRKLALLKRDELLGWFNGRPAYDQAHQTEDESEISQLITDDFF